MHLLRSSFFTGQKTGFSLVEVAIALGIFSFAMLTVLALLPVGVKSNQISAEETRAANLLTLLEADLRNTHPLFNSGKSKFFGLPLPYFHDSTSGTSQLNRTLTLNALSGGHSVPLNDSEAAVPNPSLRSRFQVSVIYTRAGSGSAADFSPVEARLIVNWPSLNLATYGSETEKISALTDLKKVNGYVESYITFPVP